MTVVVAFLRRVDADAHFEDDRFATILRRRGHFDRTRLGIFEVTEVEGFTTREPKRLRVLTVHELAGDHAHADEIRTMDTLEAFGDDGFDAEQHRAFGGPIARGARAVLLAREDDERRTGSLILHRRVVDRHRLVGGQVDRDAALGTRRQQIAQPDVGEGATHHDFVVTTACTVGIEVHFLDAVRFEVSSSRTAACDVARGRDVVGRDRVAKQGQRTRSLDRLHRFGLHLHSVEVRRIAHVGGLLVPCIEFAGWNFDRTPVGIAREHIAVATAKHLRVDGSANGLSDFLW